MKKKKKNYHCSWEVGNSLAENYPLKVKYTQDFGSGTTTNSNCEALARTLSKPANKGLRQFDYRN